MFVYLQEAEIGGFKADWYWCSSLAANGYAWRQQFSDGSQSMDGDWTAGNAREFLIRAIRQF
jgi:hypothetical protein